MYGAGPGVRKWASVVGYGVARPGSKPVPTCGVAHQCADTVEKAGIAAVVKS